MHGVAEITYDYLAERAGPHWPTRQGRQFIVGFDDERDGPETSEHFALFDDDGEIYYSGILRGDIEGLDRLYSDLFDWGAADAGTTLLEIDGEPMIHRGGGSPMMTKDELFKVKCVECGRIFDLLDETDAGEWAYGHDCEV